MKRLTLAALLLSSTVVFAEQRDEALFLSPYFKEIANQAVVDMGCFAQDASHQNVASINLMDTLDDLNQHCDQIAHALKAGGKAVISIAASHDVVFTSSANSDKSVHRHIQKVLSNLGSNEDPAAIKAALGELEEVNRASFVRRGSNLVLVTDVSELHLGEKIWRKEPTRVVQGYYHSEEECLVALRNAGLICETIDRPCFFGKVKYNLYHQGQNEELGSGYIDHNPFTLFTVVK